MQVILLERVAKLGQMGEVVKVKDGYARNFLLPQGKALRASDANIKSFETQKAQLEARNLDTKTEASAAAEKIDGGELSSSTFHRSLFHEIQASAAAPLFRLSGDRLRRQ